jgi:hypothetical protein
MPPGSVADHREEGLSDYRCYFVNPGDHIVDVQEIVAGTEAEAVEQVRALVASRPSCTAEIWQDSRLVRKNIWPCAPSRRAASESIPSRKAG